MPLIVQSGPRLFVSEPPPVTSYSTDFPGTENPISEGGAWIKPDANMTNVRTLGGHAFGTQSGSGGYDDSSAYVQDLPTDVMATATIYRDASIGSLNHEVELLFRATSNGTETFQYELLLDKDGTIVWVKWLGPHEFGFFEILDSDSIGPQQTGALLRGRVVTVGDDVQLVAWIKSVGEDEFFECMNVTDSDSPYLTGDHGIGFYINDPSSNPAHWCFSHYEIEEV